jgi:hypothetical protein
MASNPAYFMISSLQIPIAQVPIDAQMRSRKLPACGNKNVWKKNRMWRFYGF